ncbi:hypothetical protein ACWDGI_06540 [Streptomyces sp. NPDC001220]
MTYLLARLVEPLLRLFLPARGRRRRRPVVPFAYTYPYSCPYVGREAPLRGEDSPLVRPYLDLVETYV